MTGCSDAESGVDPFICTIGSALHVGFPVAVALVALVGAVLRRRKVLGVILDDFLSTCRVCSSNLGAP